MVVKERIPLMHEAMDPICKELPGLSLEPLHQCSLEIFIQLESAALHSFFEWVKHMKVIWDRLKMYGFI
jgi:hypothetical protein